MHNRSNMLKFISVKNRQTNTKSKKITWKEKRFTSSDGVGIRAFS